MEIVSKEDFEDEGSSKNTILFDGRNHIYMRGQKPCILLE